MEELRLEPIDGNDFKAYIEDDYIGCTHSPKWYSWGTRDITTADDVVYNLRSNVFIGFGYELKSDGKLLFEIRSGKFNNVILFIENETVAYVMKRDQSFFRSNLVLFDRDGGALLMMRSKFSWREFETKYTIAASEGFGNSDLEKAIIVLAIMFYDSLQSDND